MNIYRFEVCNTLPQGNVGGTDIVVFCQIWTFVKLYKKHLKEIFMFTYEIFLFLN